MGRHGRRSVAAEELVSQLPVGLPSLRSGLFLGVEFVRERTSREPATAETNWLCSRLKDEHRILTSIDGPHDNVLVIKPPLSFGLPEAAILVDALRQELRSLEAVDLSTVTHTPT